MYTYIYIYTYAYSCVCNAILIQCFFLFTFLFKYLFPVFFKYLALKVHQNYTYLCVVTKTQPQHIREAAHQQQETKSRASASEKEQPNRWENVVLKKKKKLDPTLSKPECMALI